MKAGVIGLGAMGLGMAANLARAGLLAAVWNRTRSKAEAFAAEHEGVVAESPAEVAADADVIIVCVSADADVLEVVNAMQPALAPGKVVVDTSTVAAETARRVAGVVRAAGAEFLDAPVSGGVEGARNGTMVMMVGGDEAVLERVRPVLSVISGKAAHMGPVGAGQSTKAVNQIMAAGINSAVTEALAYGEAEGLDMERVIDVIKSGAAGNWFLEHRGPTMVRGVFDPGFKVRLHRKDLGIVRKGLAEKGVLLETVERIVDEYDALIADGYGDEDISALYRRRRAIFL